MAEKIYLYPVWLRIWHAINALMFLVLIATGISMQYSHPDAPLIRFDRAVSWHNIAGIIVSLNYLIFLIGNLITKNGSFYKIKLKGLIKSLIKQFDYYLRGLFKREPAPFPISEERKFNPLQKVTYVGTMYVLVPIIIITGLALLFPETIVSKVFNYSGIYLTALLHGTVGFLLSVFLVIHVYFSTIGASPSSNFKGMINGWHEKH
ncbi:MAG: cytochrome b/b6 domain-containing protein [Bacteroidales bacterium]|jgi:thiosulfate reductase cytochrome b subunit|nr:cytochrome b/b6 domain-containing protein [Bacteroidales bacterium]MDD3702103.1 cytochrome b/b6 domain-containing protein [Bacteroidales bacterium]MDY0369610.1 cytochrome b/b6 domain-containing protein [Bacteroidales bacterium]